MFRKSLNYSNLIMKLYNKQKKTTKITTDRDTRPTTKTNNGITFLDYRFENLQRLPCIQFYNSIVHLDLRNNLISDTSSIFKISNPHLLKHIQIIDNPICLNLNYRYPIMVHFINLQKLDELTFNGDLRDQLIRYQQNLGQNIINFLYFKSKCFELFENKSVQQELSLIKKLQKTIEESQIILQLFSQNQPFYNKNIYIENAIDKICAKNEPIRDSNTIKKIKQFWIEQLLQESARNTKNKRLVQQIIEKIKITSQKEQNELAQNKQFCFIVLSQALIDEYDKNTIKSNRKSINAFTSIQTCDTYHSVTAHSIHFSLDNCYLSIVYDLIVFHIQNLLDKIAIYQNAKLGHKQKAISMAFALNKEHIQSPKLNHDDSLDFHTKMCPNRSTTDTERLQTENIINSRPTKRIETEKIKKYKQKIYQNHTLLTTIIQVFQKCIVNIIFQRLKKPRRINISSIQFLELTLKKLIQQRELNSWKKIIQKGKQFEFICLTLQQNLERKIIKKWFQVVKKKKILLRTIIMKKAKVEKVILDFTFAKWKTVSRFQNLRKTISQVKFKSFPRKNSVDKNYNIISKKYGFK